MLPFNNRYSPIEMYIGLGAIQSAERNSHVTSGCLEHTQLLLKSHVKILRDVDYIVHAEVA